MKTPSKAIIRASRSSGLVFPSGNGLHPTEIAIISLPEAAEPQGGNNTSKHHVPLRGSRVISK